MHTDLSFGPRGPVVAYLARHGDTELNDAGKFRGWSEVPLNERGHAQAHDLALHFQYQPLAGVVSSPLTRARQTADRVAAARGAEAHTDSRLMPWNVGWLGGKSRGTFAHVLQAHVNDPRKRIAGGESLDEFKARFLPALMEYAVQAEPLGSPWLLIVHTSNIEAVGGLPELTELCGPGGYCRVTLEPQGLVVWPAANPISGTGLN